MSNEQLLLLCIDASLQAGEKILEVYNSDFAIEHKEDKSPLTLADKKAHDVIAEMLSRTGIPLLSEEGKNIPNEERKNWNQLWIVDPLDGTKEFIKRNGEFTVNIALVVDQHPVMGIIYHPVADVLYFASTETGAYRLDKASKIFNQKNSFDQLKNSSSKFPKQSSREKFTIVASRSHLSIETSVFVEEMKTKHGEVEFISSGSSLKLCMVAEGLADVYPRFAPTMEWDTAAGHAIANASGKKVFSPRTGIELLYNKEDLLNDWFIVQ